MLRHFRCRRVNGAYERPSIYCLRNAIVKVAPEELDSALRAWFSAHGHDDASLAIDGKTMKGAVDEAGRQVHILGACGHETAIAWGQNNPPARHASCGNYPPARTTTPHASKPRKPRPTGRAPTPSRFILAHDERPSCAKLLSDAARTGKLKSALAAGSTPVDASCSTCSHWPCPEPGAARTRGNGSGSASRALVDVRGSLGKKCWRSGLEWGELEA